MKLTDSRQLDWGAAKRAAQSILKACDDAAYTAPEALYAHREHIVKVCSAMDEIAKALCITPPKGTP